MDYDSGEKYKCCIQETDKVISLKQKQENATEVESKGDYGMLLEDGNWKTRGGNGNYPDEEEFPGGPMSEASLHVEDEEEDDHSMPVPPDGPTLMW